MSKTVYLFNGPNLNLLGERQPEIYGAQTLADLEAACAELGAELGLKVVAKQSNHEGQLVDWIQEARSVAKGILINPAAYSHTSIALLDALNMFDGPVVEVHMSQIHKREKFRHHSYVSERSDAVFVGAGANGYLLGLRHLAQLIG